MSNVYQALGSGGQMMSVMPAGKSFPTVNSPTVFQTNPIRQQKTIQEQALTIGEPMDLRFTGSPSEYFRIWIVNLCLTLLTLGIFSAWAKVRKKRYFYSHTVLEGTPFQYLGQPIPILKGRIVAVILFLIWYLSINLFVEFIPVVLIAALILAPWVMVRSAAFNARYSAFRNMTFQFNGTYWGTIKVMYAWLLVTVLTFGIGFSWMEQRIKRYLVTHTSYGGQEGEFSATGGNFFKVYFIAGLLAGTAMVLLGVASVLLFASHMQKTSFVIIFTVLIYAVYVAMYAYIRANIINLVWNNTRLGSVEFSSTLRTRELIWIYITNALAILISLGLLIPWAVIRTLKYRIEHFSITANGDLKQFQGSSDSTVQATGSEVGDLFDFDMSI